MVIIRGVALDLLLICAQPDFMLLQKLRDPFRLLLQPLDFQIFTGEDDAFLEVMGGK